MTKARPQVLSLNGGEVDEQAIARSDIDSYANKAHVMENALPAVKGGLFRAPGTRFIGHCLDGEAVLRAWRFSRTQAFQLEIAPYAIRITYGTGYIQVGEGEAIPDTGSTWVDGSSGGATSDPSDPPWSPPPPPLPPPEWTPADRWLDQEANQN